MSTTNLARAFALIEAAAIQNRRCPMNDQVPGRSGAFSELARAGRIRVEVFKHNFRQVTILTGPHAGKKTAAPLLMKGNAQKPYLVVDKGGTFRNGTPADTGYGKRQPWRPGDYQNEVWSRGSGRTVRRA